MWFDSHCHLHLVEERMDLDEALVRARAAAVTGAVAVGIDVVSSRRALEIARGHRLWSSAGVHPTSATAWNDHAAGELERLLSEERVVAVGETGLDYYWGEVDPAVQQRAFEDHIELSKRKDKALVVHTRESVEAALDTLERVGPPLRLVFHCWSGDRDALRRALEIGAYISFAGNVTFENADRLREAALEVPLDRLVVETDAPYLSPVPHRGRPNEPAFVAATGAVLARVRGEEKEVLGEATAANARALFAVPP